MEITKSDILKLIKNNKVDNFWNHFIYVVKRDFKPTGEVKENQIKFWQQGIWAGPFYPIYTFELNSQNHLINISNKLNPVGKILYFTFPLWYISLFIINIMDDFILREFIILLIIILVFSIIYFLITKKIYNYEKEEQLKEIYEILEIETEKEIIEREWTKNKIITRLFTYPFCFLLICLNIFFLIPDGQIFLSLGSLGIVVVYLYSDLKILFK